MPDETLSEVVDEVARGPKSASVDGVSVEQHDLQTLNEVAGQQAANTAAKKTHRGLRFNKLVPPGAG